MSEPVIISAISAIGGIAIAYIVNVAAKKVQQTKSDKQPKDRMEQMFDGYERLILQKDVEDARKIKLLSELEEELNTTRDIARRLEHSLASTKHELRLSREENRQLTDNLLAMRQEYAEYKAKQLDSKD